MPDLPPRVVPYPDCTSGGLRSLPPARCQPQAARCPHRDRVLLLTDGQANHGIVDPTMLIKHAAELTEDGIATTTLGYGDDFNEDLLTALTGSLLSVLHFSFPDASCQLPAANCQPFLSGRCR